MSLYATAAKHFAHAKALFDEEFTFETQKKLSKRSSKKHVRKAAREQSQQARKISEETKRRSFQAQARFRAAYHENKLNSDKKWIREFGFCGLEEFIDEDENGNKFRRDFRALITDVDKDSVLGELTFHVSIKRQFLFCVLPTHTPGCI
jgi:hypothetical protein